MNLNEINFSFGGLHCLRDFGAIYIERSGHIISPAICRNEYEIAGMAGTLAMPGDLPELLTFGGTLFFLRDPPTQAAAQERLRRMAAWLTGGRKRLIFDYEPMRYYMASVDNPTRWSYAGWIDGGLEIEFTAQPYAYAVRESTASVTTTDAQTQLTLTLDTGEDAPLSAQIRNTGTADITSVSISAHERAVTLENLRIAPGETLRIDMETPIGASLLSGASVLPHATCFDYLSARKGSQMIAAALAYGSGEPGAHITVTARGRWL